MNKTAAIAALLVLSGCINVPTNQYKALTPEECVKHGVDVSHWLLPTGTIVSSNLGTEDDIKRECLPPVGTVPLFWAGCAKAEGTDKFPAVNARYEIWYINNPCVARHEACHALYQERDHTKEYDKLATEIGYRATCPGTE